MRHNRSSFVGLYQHITQGGVACFRGIGKVGLSLLILGVWAGCGSGVKSASEAKASTPQFVPAEIPAILDSPEQQAGYLAQHYWKNFDFTDTSFLREPKVLESVFAQYIQVIESIPVDLGETSVRKTLEKAEADSAMYRCFIGMFEKYLYDPNAPTRNEDLYLAALRQITQSTKLTETEKQRPEYQQRMSLINRPDWPASDFTYTLANGSTGTLYGIKAQYVILFLNNPGCEACRAMIHAISQSH
ncbi:MAG: DUF5106 domain-containing protein, partial [Alistipes sp.]|nr:DUF5106 domain-containing protein [Alistipes sp.]